MRHYAAILLTLLMVGCQANQQFPWLTAPSAKTSTQQQKASLCVKVSGLENRTTQAVDTSNVIVNLSIQSAARIDQVQTATLDNATASVVFDNLLPGPQIVIAEARRGEILLDRQQLGVSLEAGTTGTVLIPLHLGGSAAIGLNLSIDTSLKSLSSWKIPDGLDWAFERYSYLYYPSESGLYWLTRDGVTAPVTFNTSQRITGAGETYRFDMRNWTQIPAHAQYVETKPLGGATDVRHFQWSNTFMLPDGSGNYYNESTASIDYTVDRWISAQQGMLKEVLSQDGATISILVKDGMEE